MNETQMMKTNDINTLENITNDTKVSRRDALKNIFYGIASAVGITSLYACGSGGSSDSGSSNNGNGNGTPEPTIDHAYIVEQFKNNGWDVYDAPTSDLVSAVPEGQSWNYPVPHDRFVTSYNSRADVRGIFSGDEQTLVSYLLDNNPANDELRVSYVGDGNNKLALVIDSTDRNIGQDDGTYGIFAVQRTVTSAQADILKGL